MTFEDYDWKEVNVVAYQAYVAMLGSNAIDLSMSDGTTMYYRSGQEEPFAAIVEVGMTRKYYLRVGEV